MRALSDAGCWVLCDANGPAAAAGNLLRKCASGWGCSCCACHQLDQLRLWLHGSTPHPSPSLEGIAWRLRALTSADEVPGATCTCASWRKSLPGRSVSATCTHQSPVLLGVWIGRLCSLVSIHGDGAPGAPGPWHRDGRDSPSSVYQVVSGGMAWNG